MYFSKLRNAISSQDSLEHPACQVIKKAWDKYGEQIAANKPLRKWLRESFFKDVHLKMYEKRPIYFPLSSEKKNFVALVNIHRWTDNTLQTLLAEHLKPDEIEAYVNNGMEDILLLKNG